jgi:RNA polymerase sigma-70 factor (ECF subfamily)
MHAPAAAMPALPVTDDKRAFVRLLEEHAGIAHKVCFTYARSQADRHDLMQEISLQLWKSFPRYTPDRPFSTWMYRSALNVGISFLRKTTRPIRQTVSLDEGALDLADPNESIPAENERVQLLQQLIAALPALDRALMLLYLDDRPYREISEILGLSETNVATKLSRLKKRVRRDIAQLASRS